MIQGGSDEERQAAYDQVNSFVHSWEFADFVYRGEEIGKESMLRSGWMGEKVLDKDSLSYQAGKNYYASRRKASRD